MLKTILFHHDDLDGIGCLIVFALAHRHLGDNEVQTVMVSNKNVDDKVREVLTAGIIDLNTVIVFTDICPGKELLETLIPKFPKLYLIDHHKTNLYTKELLSTAIIIPEIEGKLESGTSLTYHFYSEIAQRDPGDPRGLFFKNHFNLVDEFVDTVRSYDTYEWKETNNILAKKLQTLFHLLGAQRFAAKYIGRFENLLNVRPEDDGMLISHEDLFFVEAKMEQEQRLIDSITIDDVVVVDIKGYKTAVRYSSGGMNISELSHQFLSRYPEIDVFLGISIIGGDISFRCIRDDLDTGALMAKPMGGGGHPKASGCPIPEEFIKEFRDKESELYVGFRDQVLKLVQGA